MTGLNVLRALYPEEERVTESRVTAERMDYRDAEHMVDTVRQEIFDRGFAPVEGPKVFRERVGQNGEVMHVVSVVAIVRKLPREVPRG